MSFLKQVFTRIKQNYAFGNAESYFSEKNQIGSLRDLKRKCVQDSLRETNYTEQEIVLAQCPFGSSSGAVVGQHGKPSFIFDENKTSIKGHMVYFYVKYWEDHRLLYQFHFLNNTLFFGAISVSSGIQDMSMDILQSGLLNKYDNDLKSGKIIKDGLDNIIYRESNFSWRINYLTGNKVMLNSIQHVLSEFEIKQSVLKEQKMKNLQKLV